MTYLFEANGVDMSECPMECKALDEQQSRVIGKLIDLVIAKERERCAKIAENEKSQWDSVRAQDACRDIAIQIRIGE